MRFESHLSSIMVYDESLVPAVEVFVSPNLHLELLQQGLVGPFTHSVHRGTYIIQDAHDAWRILVYQEETGGVQTSLQQNLQGFLPLSLGQALKALNWILIIFKQIRSLGAF